MTSGGQLDVDWVCLDIGETLIDETRIWSTWADVLGIPRFTLMGVLGGVVADGGDHRDAFPLLGIEDWARREPEVQAAYGGFVHGDLYPDALPSVRALRGSGLRIAVIGNQPATRSAELRALGVEADVMAMSDEIGASKPAPAFFARCAELLDAAPERIAYVGDRIDNDVRPARAAGLRAVWLRRGPWGHLHRDDGADAHLVVGSLGELVEVLG
jgi:HAD superfamily hydrolase (TIGR01549 family)